jgi:hypothetical protein
MRRAFQFAWVLALNGLVVWALFTRLFGETPNRNAQTPLLWLQFSLMAVLPILGIVLELAGWKSARWVNVGGLTLAGCFWLGSWLWFGGILLFVGLALLIAAGLTELIYRFTVLKF